jgi:hypothetical protein
MKHIKKHPINDKAQKLSKDMKKQELVKPKTDKKLDADKSLSDPDVSMRVSKPSNKKLDGEKFLSEGLKHLKRFNEMLDPMGKWTPEEDDKNKIHIPIEYSGVIMELGEEVDPNDIISLYNEIVEEGTPLVSYSEYGTEGKFYNEDDDEIPTDAILDVLNYAIGLDGGELEGLDESKKSGVSASLKKKSQASGIPMGILRKVFAKGMQAWNAGHRPGVAQHQWGMGRVNSFITGAGGARKADADLWTKAKAAKARKKKKK